MRAPAWTRAAGPRNWPDRNTQHRSPQLGARVLWAAVPVRNDSVEVCLCVCVCVWALDGSWRARAATCREHLSRRLEQRERPASGSRALILHSDAPSGRRPLGSSLKVGGQQTGSVEGSRGLACRAEGRETDSRKARQSRWAKIGGVDLVLLGPKVAPPPSLHRAKRVYRFAHFAASANKWKGAPFPPVQHCPLDQQSETGGRKSQQRNIHFCQPSLLLLSLLTSLVFAFLPACCCISHAAPPELLIELCEIVLGAPLQDCLLEGASKRQAKD